MFYILCLLTMINNESYVVIWGWMLNNLKLKWNELVAYATIYSFTNGTEEHCYKWSAGYLAERCWIDKRSALRILQKLEEKWLIFRKDRFENWVKFVDYCTNVIGGDKMSLGGSDKMSHHNAINDNNSNNPIKTPLPKQNLELKLANICKGDLTFTENVIERLNEYNNTRKKKLEKLTDKWFKLVIDKLVELWRGTEDWMIAVLKQSVEKWREWLFEVKGYKPKVDYENNLQLFLTRLKTDYEWLKKEVGTDKFFELKQRALEYWAANKLL